MSEFTAGTRVRYETGEEPRHGVVVEPDAYGDEFAIVQFDDGRTECVRTKWLTGNRRPLLEGGATP